MFFFSIYSLSNGKLIFNDGIVEGPATPLPYRMNEREGEAGGKIEISKAYRFHGRHSFLLALPPGELIVLGIFPRKRHERRASYKNPKGDPEFTPSIHERTYNFLLFYTACPSDGFSYKIASKKGFCEKLKRTSSP